MKSYLTQAGVRFRRNTGLPSKFNQSLLSERMHSAHEMQQGPALVYLQTKMKKSVRNMFAASLRYMHAMNDRLRLKYIIPKTSGSERMHSAHLSQQGPALVYLHVKVGQAS